ncbi:MAG TPA: HyaD/HybD family hydrogenase maturation endopeptidase [Bryobacteraceae bacterium]|nr:HyaD/HybD family hydrogenase maturation endopeptidase [Bryobacteraceae bacterium]
MRTLVLGLGNLVHGDDGLGVHAIERLQKDPRVPGGVVLMDGGTQGMSLIPHISGFERVLVIDAIDVGRDPGTLIRIEGEEVHKMHGKPSVHQLGFADLMIALKLLDSSPKEVIVLGVQPQSTEWSANLSAPVEASLDGICTLVIEQLNAWRP